MKIEKVLEIFKDSHRIGCNVINANDEETQKYVMESIEALEEGIKIIKRSRWIPVNEKNPSDYGLERVLVQLYHKFNGPRQVHIGTFHKYPGEVCDWYIDDINLWVDSNNDFEVVAWMPLPDIYYKEEQNDKSKR